MAEAFVLENQHIRLVIVPQNGARVTSLIDKKSGREWLVQGAGDTLPPEPEAVYGGAEAAGWDECFPTITRVRAASATAWHRPLRDHGELWGRPWQVEEANGTRLTTRYASPEFTFTRTLELDGLRVECSYEVVTAGRRALPFLWAQHVLLAVTPADRIVLPGVKLIDADYMQLNGEVRMPQTYSWPGPGGVLGIPLDAIHPERIRLAAKFHAEAPLVPMASVGNETGWLDFVWDAEELPYLGLWMNYGVWPSDRPQHHLSIEPTTTAHDSIADATPQQRRHVLRRDAPFVWTVTLALREGT